MKLVKCHVVITKHIKHVDSTMKDNQIFLDLHSYYLQNQNWYNQQDGGLPEKQRLSESTQPAPEGLLASGQGKQKLAIRSIFEYTEEAQMAPSFLSKMARHLPWWHVFLLDDGLTLLDTYRYSSHWKNTRAMILYRDDRSNVTQIPVRIIYVNQFSQDHP